MGARTERERLLFALVGLGVGLAVMVLVMLFGLVECASVGDAPVEEVGGAPAAGDPSARPGPALEADAQARIADLERQLARARERIAKLEAEKADRLAASTRAISREDVLAGITPDELDALAERLLAAAEPLDEGLRVAGRGLGLGERTLRLARAVARQFEEASAESRILMSEVLRRLGPTEAFQAVVIVLSRGDGAGAAAHRLVGSVAVPGGEELLIDTLEGLQQDPRFASWGLIRGLGRFDTPRAREYLLQRLEVESDPGRLMSTVEALADLGEAGLVDRLSPTRLDAEALDLVRPHIFEALVRLGGEPARQFFRAYLDRREAIAAGEAIVALAGIDEALATTYARTVLGDPERAARLTPEIRPRVVAISGA